MAIGISYLVIFAKATWNTSWSKDGSSVFEGDKFTLIAYPPRSETMFSSSAGINVSITRAMLVPFSEYNNNRVNIYTDIGDVGFAASELLLQVDPRSMHNEQYYIQSLNRYLAKHQDSWDWKSVSVAHYSDDSQIITLTIRPRSGRKYRYVYGLDRELSPFPIKIETINPLAGLGKSLVAVSLIVLGVITLPFTIIYSIIYTKRTKLRYYSINPPANSA